MYDFNDQFKTVMLEKMRVAVSSAMGLSSLKMHYDLDGYLDYAGGVLVARLQSFMLKGPAAETVTEWVEFKWLSNWWESLKESRFPKWYLRRWPVQYKVERVCKTRVTEYRVCPHTRVPENQHQVHLQYLAGVSDSGQDSYQYPGSAQPTRETAGDQPTGY